MTQSLRSTRDDLCGSEGDAEGEYVVGTIGGIDAAEGECGLSRRCSGWADSDWIATLSRISLDAPLPRASNAFIRAWSMEGGISGNRGLRLGAELVVRAYDRSTAVSGSSQFVAIMSQSSELFAVAGRSHTPEQGHRLTTIPSRLLSHPNGHRP
jgi:hypothetical protein